jgi:hypothetical protein
VSRSDEQSTAGMVAISVSGLVLNLEVVICFEAARLVA